MNLSRCCRRTEALNRPSRALDKAGRDVGEYESFQSAANRMRQPAFFETQALACREALAATDGAVS